MAVEQIGTGNDDGATFGNGLNEKISFHGVTPIIQPSSADQAAAPAGGTGAAAGAYDTANNRDLMIALVNEMRNVLINNGLMKGSA